MMVSSGGTKLSEAAEPLYSSHALLLSPALSHLLLLPLLLLGRSLEGIFSSSEAARGMKSTSLGLAEQLKVEVSVSLRAWQGWSDCEAAMRSCLGSAALWNLTLPGGFQSWTLRAS